MSDPRGWDKHKDAIEAAKAEILAEIARNGGKLDLGVTAKSVKSVQYQVKNTTGASLSFVISEVDTEKSVPFIALSSNGSIAGLYISSFTSTDVTVKDVNSNGFNRYVSLFVIEFN